MMVEVSSLYVWGSLFVAMDTWNRKVCRKAKELSLGYPSGDVHSKTEYTNLEVRGWCWRSRCGDWLCGSLRKAGRQEEKRPFRNTGLKGCGIHSFKRYF